MYVGRFAPSPSGPLHLGSLVVALASYLDARVAAGQWLVRIEDLDTPRCVPGADQIILRQLTDLGMRWDGDIWYQSDRKAAYQTAFETLTAQGLVYPCGCTRREIADAVLAAHGALPAGERPYPGTCRSGLPQGRLAKAWRFWVEPGVVSFHDRWCGEKSQCVDQEVGDFVVLRADGIWAYQLAVVVDDAAQGVTDVVRGQDLLTSTARQQLLAQALGVSVARVMHLPLVTDENGLKLSKQNGAPSIDTDNPLITLLSAWQYFGLGPLAASSLDQFWTQATASWAAHIFGQRLAP